MNAKKKKSEKLQSAFLSSLQNGVNSFTSGHLYRLIYKQKVTVSKLCTSAKQI
jgi:hypothetical protein